MSWKSVLFFCLICASPAYALQSATESCERAPLYMYSASWCPFCTTARNYMQANNIEFVEVMVDKLDREQAHDVLTQISAKGFRAYPFFVHGRTTWTGWASPERLQMELCLE